LKEILAHNITSRATLNYGRKIWILTKGTTEIRGNVFFLGPVLGFSRYTPPKILTSEEV
jgi:hypothetical protein